MLIQLDSKFTSVKLVSFIVICQSFVSFLYFCIVCRFLSYPLWQFRIVSICSSLVSYHLLYACPKFVSFVKIYQEIFFRIVRRLFVSVASQELLKSCHLTYRLSVRLSFFVSFCIVRIFLYRLQVPIVSSVIVSYHQYPHNIYVCKFSYRSSVVRFVGVQYRLSFVCIVGVFGGTS